MGFIKRRIEKIKRDSDISKGGQILYILKKFYCPNRKKDFIVQMIVNDTDFSIEDFEELSNLFGREAHDRVRALKYCG